MWRGFRAHSPLWCRSLRPQSKASSQLIDWVRACKSSGLQTSRLAANHDLLRAAIGLRHCTLGEQYLSGVGKFTTVVHQFAVHVPSPREKHGSAKRAIIERAKENTRQLNRKRAERRENTNHWRAITRLVHGCCVTRNGVSATDHEINFTTT
jgi:hypothetical protein